MSNTANSNENDLSFGDVNFENNYVKINGEHFPKLLISIKNHTPTKSEFEAFLDAMKRSYTNEKARIILFDLTQARNVSLLFQVRFARWSLNMKPIFAKHLKGVTFQVSNKLIKGILKSIFLLQKPNYDFEVCDSQLTVEAHQSILRQRVE